MSTEMKETQLACGIDIGDDPLILASKSVNLGGPTTAELNRMALLRQTTGLSDETTAVIIDSSETRGSAITVAPPVPSRLYIVSDSPLRLRANHTKAGHQGPETTSADGLLQSGTKSRWSVQPAVELINLVSVAQSHDNTREGNGSSRTGNRLRLRHGNRGLHPQIQIVVSQPWLVTDDPALSTYSSCNGVIDKRNIMVQAPSNIKMCSCSSHSSSRLGRIVSLWAREFHMLKIQTDLRRSRPAVWRTLRRGSSTGHQPDRVLRNA